MLHLYHYWSSVCSQKVRTCLVEKKLSWQSRHVDLFNFENYQPWYTTLNPKAVVPTLDHDGRILIESNVILEYLEDNFAETAAAARRSLRALEDAAVDLQLRGTGTLERQHLLAQSAPRQAPRAEEDLDGGAC